MIASIVKWQCSWFFDFVKTINYENDDYLFLFSPSLHAEVFSLFFKHFLFDEVCQDQGLLVVSSLSNNSVMSCNVLLGL